MAHLASSDSIDILQPGVLPYILFGGLLAQGPTQRLLGASSDLEYLISVGVFYVVRTAPIPCVNLIMLNMLEFPTVFLTDILIQLLQFLLYIFRTAFSHRCLDFTYVLISYLTFK